MLEEIKEKWPEILDFLKQEFELTDISFKTWILPLKVESFENNTLTLIFSGETKMSGLVYVNKKYCQLLKIAIEESINKEINLEITLPNDTEINEEFIDNLADQEMISLENRIQEANLDKKYTFDSFVVGSNNDIAQVTSLAAAESPGEIYNPLFIYGGVGLGKTHLIQSIGNFVLANNPNAKVLYTTSENFTNEVIDLLGNKKNKTSQEDIIEFRQKYRNVDVLLIDDIQFISNKDRTQEEIFNIYNDLFMKHKQIVFTSDRKPKDMEGIEDRLINRFEQGLTVDIHNPDYETRMAILKRKAESLGYDLDESVLQFIANNFTANVRELEGSLTRIISFSKIKRTEITLELAKDALKDLISPNQEEKITCESIINIVAEHYQISVSDICSSKRSKEFTIPRQICMYLCIEYTDDTLKQIATLLKKDNHATISYGKNKISKLMKTDAALKTSVDILKKKISPN